jgi:pimeloyl-ACP methyl ester carboxylesterase
VVAHGFAASVQDPNVEQLADDLFAAGMDVVLYDARGHGRSGGECSVGSLERLDVACVVERYATPELPCVLIGVSMGAVAVLSYLAGDKPRRAVTGAVLVSSPGRWRMRPSPVGVLTMALTRTSPGRWAARRYIGVSVSRQWSPGPPPEEAIARVQVPVVVIHGRSDRLLSTSHARRLHRAAGADARLRLVEGMGHGLDVLGREATAEAVDWIVRHSIIPSTRTAR